MRVIIFHSIIYLFLYTVCDCDSKVHNWLFFHILFILQYTFCIFSFSLCNVHWLYSDNLRHHHKPSLPRGEHQQCLKWHLFIFALAMWKKEAVPPSVVSHEMPWNTKVHSSCLCPWDSWVPSYTFWFSYLLIIHLTASFSSHPNWPQSFLQPLNDSEVNRHKFYIYILEINY